MKEIILFSILALMLFWETKSPLFPISKDRWQHATQNIGIKLFNTIFVYFLFSAIFHTQLLKDPEYGLLNLWHIPYWLEILAVFLICDLFMYLFHIANHKIPILWKLHRTHHTDTFVDATTSLRRHIGEIIILDLIFLFGIFPIFGISFIQFFLYQIIIDSISMFHHGNIIMPTKLDNILRMLIVTPNMHRIHHSDISIETDSNYGTVFSFWDRVFKTYRTKDKLSNLRYGLKEFAEPKWQTFKGMLITPFT